MLSELQKFDEVFVIQINDKFLIRVNDVPTSLSNKRTVCAFPVCEDAEHSFLRSQSHCQLIKFWVRWVCIIILTLNENIWASYVIVLIEPIEKPSCAVV